MEHTLMKLFVSAALAMAATTIGAAAQVNGPGYVAAPPVVVVPMYDRAPTGSVPTRQQAHPGFTGTMPNKWVGPGATAGDSYGPDGSPGNGSPSKQDGSME